MDKTTKAKIKKQIKNKEVLAVSGYRVRITEILEDGRVRVKRMKLSKNSFAYFTVEYSRIESIIKNPYSHKNPVAFLKRNGFSPICSDEGRPLMEKQIDGKAVIIGFSDPATQSSSDISLGIESKSGGTWYKIGVEVETDFQKVLNEIPSFMKQVKEWELKKKTKKK